MESRYLGSFLLARISCIDSRKLMRTQSRPGPKQSSIVDLDFLGESFHRVKHLQFELGQACGLSYCDTYIQSKGVS